MQIESSVCRFAGKFRRQFEVQIDIKIADKRIRAIKTN